MRKKESSGQLPLTTEQQQLITDYLSDNYKRVKQSIYVVMKRKLTSQEVEECIGVAHEALCKAAARYRNDRKMKFSSFANMTIQSSLKTYLTYENRDKRVVNKKAYSLDSMMGDDEDICLKDLLIGESGIDIQEYDRINRYLKTISNDAKKVLSMRLQGHPYIYISNTLGFDKKYMRELLLSMQKYEKTQILRRELR